MARQGLRSRPQHTEELSIAKKFLRLAGFEISNDVLRSRVDMPRMFTKTVDRAPTLDELRRILLHTNSRGKAMVNLLASSGMRIGELLSLRVKDVDLARRPVTVFLRAEVTKDRQARYCFASDEAAALLREYLGARAGKPDEYVFNTTTRGRAHATGNLPMTYWNADRIFTLAVRHSSKQLIQTAWKGLISLLAPYRRCPPALRALCRPSCPPSGTQTGQSCPTWTNSLQICENMDSPSSRP